MNDDRAVRRTFAEHKCNCSSRTSMVESRCVCTFVSFSIRCLSVLEEKNESTQRAHISEFRVRYSRPQPHMSYEPNVRAVMYTYGAI